MFNFVLLHKLVAERHDAFIKNNTFQVKCIMFDRMICTIKVKKTNSITKIEF